MHIKRKHCIKTQAKISQMIKNYWLFSIYLFNPHCGLFYFLFEVFA